MLFFKHLQQRQVFSIVSSETPFGLSRSVIIFIYCFLALVVGENEIKEILSDLFVRSSPSIPAQRPCTSVSINRSIPRLYSFNNCSIEFYSNDRDILRVSCWTQTITIVERTPCTVSIVFLCVLLITSDTFFWFFSFEEKRKY